MRALLGLIVSSKIPSWVRDQGVAGRNVRERYPSDERLPGKSLFFYEKQKNIIELVSRLLLEQASPLAWPAWHGEDIALPGARSETLSQTQ